MSDCSNNIGECLAYLFENVVSTVFSAFSSLWSVKDDDDEARLPPDWTLATIDIEKLIIFVFLSCFFFVLNMFLWETMWLKPMKLLAVFVHEMSHAIACWLTCGEVLAIKVFSNEGGVTHFRGGIQLCIIPAGYLGCAFWGAVFVALSGGRIASTIVASLISIALLISLFYSPNRVMIKLSLGFFVLTVGCIAIEWYVFSPFLNFLTLYYGVSIGTFSVYDIRDDLIMRTVQGSDAYACYEIIPCCYPKCVGVQFILIALVFQVIGIYLALVWLTTKG